MLKEIFAISIQMKTSTNHLLKMTIESLFFLELNWNELKFPNIIRTKVFNLLIKEIEKKNKKIKEKNPTNLIKSKGIIDDTATVSAVSNVYIIV